MDFTHDDLWWLFSTIPQTYGTLIALFGALAIYRWERLRRMSDECWKRAEKPYEELTHENTYSADDLLDKWRRTSSEEKHQWKHSNNPEVSHKYIQVNTQVDMIRRYLRWHGKLRMSFAFFLIYHLPFLFIAISGIPYAQELAGTNIETIGKYPEVLFRLSLFISAVSIGWLMLRLFTDNLQGTVEDQFCKRRDA